MGFWKWLGSKLASTFKGFIRSGGWVTFPMILHAYIGGVILKNDALAPTLFLWLIPMILNFAYFYYTDFVKEDC